MLYKSIAVQALPGGTDLVYAIKMDNTVTTFDTAASSETAPADSVPNAIAIGVS